MRNASVAIVCLALALAGCRSELRLKEPPAGSVQHIVLIKFKDGVTPDQTKEIFRDFRALQAKIPGIISLQEGPDMSKENLQKGFTRGVIVTFQDRAARDAYLDHPEHVAFKEKAIPTVADLLVLDFQVGP